MVSMGAVGATILFPILILFMDGNYFVYSVIVAVIVIFNHRENIKRILNGTENKLSFKK
jgi:glycerol-3-phosphate acyltransferase PlsY